MKPIHLALVLALAACAALPKKVEERPAPDIAETTPPEMVAPPPPPLARTVEQFDTTTPEQRAAAAAPDTGGARLGTTVASLGDPARPGFWLETDLVTEARSGRVETASGKGADVELIPLAGDGGSRISLAALRLLDVPLTDLPTLTVYAR